jgi:phage terminase small subunit
MAAPRKPTNLLLLSGSIAHDKKRYASRTKEPKPNGELGKPPKSLCPELKEAWKEVVKSVPEGVLTSADRIIVELASRLTLKMREGTISTGETAQLISCLSRLGLTPADRSRVSVDPSKATSLMPGNRFTKFAS